MTETTTRITVLAEANFECAIIRLCKDAEAEGPVCAYFTEIDEGNGPYRRYQTTFDEAMADFTAAARFEELERD